MVSAEKQAVMVRFSSLMRSRMSSVATPRCRSNRDFVGRFVRILLYADGELLVVLIQFKRILNIQKLNPCAPSSSENAAMRAAFSGNSLRFPYAKER
jgi:hypothetical protein